MKQFILKICFIVTQETIFVSNKLFLLIRNYFCNHNKKPPFGGSDFYFIKLSFISKTCCIVER